MSTIQINSQHRGNLDLADIQNIKTNAKEGDTVKFGSVFGKEYSVTKSNDGEISLKQKENRSFFNRFFSKTDSSKNSDLKLNLMNQQLHKKENNCNVNGPDVNVQPSQPKDACRDEELLPKPYPKG